MKAISVLLAEDELALAHIVRESLEQRGFSVVVCSNGELAIKEYERNRPDILILDIMMPEMDGYQVAEKNTKYRQANTHYFPDSQVPV